MRTLERRFRRLMFKLALVELGFWLLAALALVALLAGLWRTPPFQG